VTIDDTNVVVVAVFLFSSGGIFYLNLLRSIGQREDDLMNTATSTNTNYGITSHASCTPLLLRISIRGVQLVMSSAIVLLSYSYVGMYTSSERTCTSTRVLRILLECPCNAEGDVVPLVVGTLCTYPIVCLVLLLFHSFLICSSSSLRLD
jgi:hypothetical protein